MDEFNSHQPNSQKAFLISLYLVLLLWLVKWTEYNFSIDLVPYGIIPQKLYGLRGIIFSPFIHGDTVHLLNNSLPIFLLTMALIYFYQSIALRVVFLSQLVGGLLTWIIATNGSHIGASGIIYSLASFLFFSGVFRKHPRLMAISLIVVFIYGGMVWGVFPIKQGVSWEGHLSGGIAGLLIALVYRKIGPQKKTFKWQKEEEKTEFDLYLEDLAIKAGEDYENLEKESREKTDELRSKPIKYHYKKNSD
jgi:membrane associated rhomboid family serine protease